LSPQVGSTCPPQADLLTPYLMNGMRTFIATKLF
jgi:hypothetical protein